jgi:hypothetical protein
VRYPLYRNDTLSGLTIAIVDDTTEYVVTVNRSRTWRALARKGDLLAEALMGPGGVMIGDKLRHHPSQMSLTDDR